MHLTNKQTYPMTDTLTRRLRKEKIKLSKSWAALHREVIPSDRLDTHIRSLRRCDRLQSALQTVVGGGLL